MFFKKIVRKNHRNKDKKVYIVDHHDNPFYQVFNDRSFIASDRPFPSVWYQEDLTRRIQELERKGAIVPVSVLTFRSVRESYGAYKYPDAWYDILHPNGVIQEAVRMGRQGIPIESLRGCKLRFSTCGPQLRKGHLYAEFTYFNNQIIQSCCFLLVLTSF